MPTINHTTSYSENKNVVRGAVQAILITSLISVIVVPDLYSSDIVEFPIGNDFLFGFFMALIENTCVIIFILPGFAVYEAIWLATTLCLALFTQLLPFQDVDYALIALFLLSIVLFNLKFPFKRRKYLRPYSMETFNLAPDNLNVNSPYQLNF